MLVTKIETKGALLLLTTDGGTRWLRPAQGVQRMKR